MPSPSHPLINPRQLGTILQSARKAQRLTQAELAERVGMSQSRVSYLEKNAAEISVGQLMRMCTVLGLELTIGTRDKAGTATTSGEDW
mgnify:CR=1 FL=1